jgi:quinol monooxygenase YgiN
MRGRGLAVYHGAKLPSRPVPPFEVDPLAMIHVIATIELNPGRREDFLAEFRSLAPLVHAEDGCIEYGAAIDVAIGHPAQPPCRPDVVTVVEKWASVEHLKRHLDAPHMREHRERAKGLVVGLALSVMEPA